MIADSLQNTHLLEGLPNSLIFQLRRYKDHQNKMESILLSLIDCYRSDSSGEDKMKHE